MTFGRAHRTPGANRATLATHLRKLHAARPVAAATPQPSPVEELAQLDERLAALKARFSALTGRPDVTISGWSVHSPEREMALEIQAAIGSISHAHRIADAGKLDSHALTVPSSDVLWAERKVKIAAALIADREAEKERQRAADEAGDIADQEHDADLEDGGSR